MLQQAQRPVLLVGERSALCRSRAGIAQLDRTATNSDADHLDCCRPARILASLIFRQTRYGGTTRCQLHNTERRPATGMGCRMDFSITGFNRAQFARSAKIAVVDIDPAEIGQAWRVARHAIHCRRQGFHPRITGASGPDTQLS